MLLAIFFHILNLKLTLIWKLMEKMTEMLLYSVCAQFDIKFLNIIHMHKNSYL